MRKVFTTPGVRPVLDVVITRMLAHNILYTYVAPVVAQDGLAAHVAGMTSINKTPLTGVTTLSPRFQHKTPINPRKTCGVQEIREPFLAATHWVEQRSVWRRARR
ncbi:hypothetical protein PUN4_1120005 [Paraburkholderia unamae]|nr:hypothetical protein PUN4_1120005 [Paraburkholderia unamae]